MQKIAHRLAERGVEGVNSCVLHLAAVFALFFHTPACAAQSAEIRNELAAAIDAIYGLELEKAARAAAELKKNHPGHPVGPLYESFFLYERWLIEGTPRDKSWNEVDAALKETLKAADRLKETSPAEAKYYRGAALGFRSRGLAAQHRYVPALPDAVKAVRELRGALALDPDLTDARLGLGLFHYFASRLPAAARPFTYLLAGETADRSRGLAELWSVANSTCAARMEARSVLTAILSKDDEADWTTADKLLVELMTRYPRNPLYRLRRIYVAERRGDFKMAGHLADPDAAWLKEIHASLRGRARSQALYRTAEAELLGGDADRAERALTALDESALPKSLRPWARLRRGNLADVRGKREDALNFYRDLQNSPAGDAARRGLAQPFHAGTSDVAPYLAAY